MALRCVITGGHFTPGLAIIEELQERNWGIYWIGVERAVLGTKSQTLEAKFLPLGIPFFGIRSAKFHRSSLLKSLVSSWELILGFFQSFKILRKLKPQVVLSFGSFVSVPVAFSAWILGIPIVVHEQTVVSGLANRIVSLIADFVAISFPTSKPFFPEEKTVVTGNLLRRNIFEIAKKRKKQKNNPPVLYITGGSRGSLIINENILQVIEKLLSKFVIYHQTGEIDFKRIEKVKSKLSQEQKSRYNIAANFTFDAVDRIFGKADLVITRAGANTVSEIALLGIPAIFIPIAKTDSNEQYKNAKILSDLEIAEIIEEKVFSANTLLDCVNRILSNYPKYKKNYLQAKKLIPNTACQKVAELLEKCTLQ